MSGSWRGRPPLIAGLSAKTIKKEIRMRAIRFLTMATCVVLLLGAYLMPSAAQARAKDPEAVFMSMDVDKDGKVTKAEFLAVYKNKARAERLFKVYDKDGNGYLVKQEYVVTARKLSEERKAKRAQRQFDKMDTNKDGKVSKEEFLAHHQAYLEKKFKAYDKNGDGYLVKEELTISVQKLPKK